MRQESRMPSARCSLSKSWTSLAWADGRCANELSANGNVQVGAAGRHRIVGGEQSRMGHAEPGDAAGDAAAGSRRRRRRDRRGRSGGGPVHGHQAQLSDALLREPSLAGLPLTPTVHVPMRRGTPATIELMGRVPTPELKDTVLRIVRDEAARIRSDVQIEDRLSVVPTMARVA